MFFGNSKKSIQDTIAKTKANRHYTKTKISLTKINLDLSHQKIPKIISLVSNNPYKSYFANYNISL